MDRLLDPVLSDRRVLLEFAASWIITACAAGVFIAVLMNFLRARESGTGQVRRSPVATASMTLFFVLFYLVVHLRIGAVPVHGWNALLILTVAGLVLVVTGAIVNVAGRLDLGGNWADQVTLYDEQTLVTTGAYGVVRHPLYASLIWMFLGASIVFHNPLALALALLVFLPAMSYRAKQEEQLLEEQFSEYTSYRRAVPMFFPRFIRRRST